MFVSALPEGVNLSLIAIVAAVIFILSLTLLGVFVLIFAKKRKKALDEENRKAASEEVRLQAESESTG